MLQCLRGDHVTIDMDTGDDDLAQASPVRTMELNSFELTPQVLKLVPMLPKLRFQRIFYCSVSDQVAAIELLQQVKEQNCAETYPCAVEDVMLFGGREGWTWAEELVVAFMGTLRLLKEIELLDYSNDTVKRISDQFPNVKVCGGTW
ncbi:hypothetical protein GQ42DRAFT_172421 [Ramicandelaber brevisporus]|nr:hypothetical protein GQ42DRAFT_172421 [Ramicandelaber brevisporus]